MAILIVLARVPGTAQADRAAELLTSEVKPGMTVVVRKHETGADLVEVTMLRRDYPPDLLRTQSARVGELLGAPVRGLEILRPSEDRGAISFIKAKFGTDGLIDRAQGTFRLEPLAKAFAGAPAPFTVEAMVVSFQNELAGERTLRSYGSSAVAVYGTQLQNPNVIEYRVRLISQDPARISIPLQHSPESPNPGGGKPGPSTPRWILPTAVALSSVAAGLLVYLLLLGPSRRNPRTPTSRRDTPS